MSTPDKNLNKGVDLESLSNFKEKVIADVSKADRRPVMVGVWNGSDEALVSFDGKQLIIGGENRLNAMQTLLASFIACDIDVVAMHASFIGVKIDELSIEASGHFNVQAYIGATDTPGSGFREIKYTIRLKTPEITQEQIDFLIERCEKSSPVGDTLSRSVPLKLEFITS